jgi:hypothetical protein
VLPHWRETLLLEVSISLKFEVVEVVWWKVVKIASRDLLPEIGASDADISSIKQASPSC